MSATTETNTTKDPYGPSDRAYASVKRVSKLNDLTTGDKILFTPLMKSLYFHIWRFQKNGGHGWVWDNQDYIAWELGTTKPALGRAINSLAAAGVVEIKEKGRGSLKSYAYQVVNPNRVVEMGFTPPAPSRTAGMFKASEFKTTDEAGKNDGKSESREQPAAVEPSTLDNDEQHSIQHTGGVGGDDLALNDALDLDNGPASPAPKRAERQIDRGSSASRRRRGSFSPTIVDSESSEYPYGEDYPGASTHQPDEAIREPSREELEEAGF